MTGCWLIATAIVATQSRGAFPGTLDQHPAIDYRAGALSDAVMTLQRDVARGAVTLKHEGRHGFLLSVLEHLDVPVASQLLLFSKTGIQNAFTGPEHPRALYFNDRVVVGYIPGAPFIELASHDPTQGVIFRTLKQDAWLPAQFARPDRCTGCHVSANSLDVPGILVRACYRHRRAGDAATRQLSDRSPRTARAAVGGWYVTARTGRRGTWAIQR
jgi:hypothetical protein